MPPVRPAYTTLPEPVPRSRNCMERYTASAKRIKFLKRLTKIGHMDFQFALWQMIYLFVSPQKVFRDFVYRKRNYIFRSSFYFILFFFFKFKQKNYSFTFLKNTKINSLATIQHFSFCLAQFSLVSEFFLLYCNNGRLINLYNFIWYMQLVQSCSVW